MQKIERGVVVVLNFSVWDAESDELLDDAWTVRDYAYIHGIGQMPAGFESQMERCAVGVPFVFEVERAYGERNGQLVQKVDMRRLPAGLEVGMVIEMEVADEPDAPPLLFHVKAIRDGLAHLDGNHPFAGKRLRFEGEMQRVRQALPEELETGRIRKNL